MPHYERYDSTQIKKSKEKKERAKAGIISRERYESYVRILKDILNEK